MSSLDKLSMNSNDIKIDVKKKNPDYTYNSPKNSVRSLSPNANIDIGLSLLVNPEKQKPVKNNNLNIKNNIDFENNNQDELEHNSFTNNDNDNKGIDLLDEIDSFSNNNETIDNSILTDKDLEEMVDKQDLYDKDLASNENIFDKSSKINTNGNINIIREEDDSYSQQDDIITIKNKQIFS